MEIRDPYKILGLEKGATAEEVKRAYRKLAMKYHPDKNNGDDSKFKEIAQAYEQITNPNKSSDGAFEWGGGEWQDFFDAFANGSFTSSRGFADSFDTRFSFNRNQKGRNTFMKLDIRIHEAYYGTKRKIRVGVNKDIELTIPRGTKPGQKLRLTGLGQRGISEDLNGDLIVTINVINDGEYGIDNKGFHVIHKVNAIDAMTGYVDIVHVMDKKIKFTIPAGTQHEEVLRIKNKGFPIYNTEDEYGDLYIHIRIKIPKNLTEENIKKLKSIKKEINERV